MQSPINISQKTARRFMLRHQHLLPPKKLIGKEGIISLINHLGCIQYDTINSVGRNADLMLQSRIKNYHPSLLKELLYEERSLIDGWDKMASIYQTNDWPYFSRTRFRFGEFYAEKSKEVLPYLPKVLKLIEENGPISAIDIKENFGKIDWFWGNATSIGRAALEILHHEGKIGINHKVGTRRVFDLIERLVPSEIRSMPNPFSSKEDYHEWHYLRRLGSMGLGQDTAGVHWSGIREDGSKAKSRKLILAKLLEKNLIIEVNVNNTSKSSYFIREQDLPTLEAVSSLKSIAPKVSLIAPLDNLIWDRGLISQIFNFDYRWEVYHPKAKRKYGYYVLPVIFKDQIVGRIDLVFDRKEKSLELTNWWWEKGKSSSATFEKAFKSCIRQFSKTLDCKSIDWDSFTNIYS